MAFLTGREIILALKKAATWRTPVQCGANDGILITSESIGAKAPNFVDDDSLALTEIEETYNLSEGLSGSSIQGYLRYEGWDVALALILGTAGTPSGSAAYSNTYYPAADIEGKFATIAVKKRDTGKAVWEVPSAKMHGFQIVGNVGQLTTITVNFKGNKIENENPGNTAASLLNVTYPTKKNILKMDAGFKMRMNVQSGIALADGDKIYPHGFTLTYNRPMSEDYESAYTDMSEPGQDGHAEVSLELRFDKYNLDTFMSAIANNTAQKMDIVFNGDEITVGGDCYLFRVDIPKIVFKSADAPVGGPGKIPHTITGRPMAVTVAPTGMTATMPISISVRNTRSTDPLA